MQRRAFMRLGGAAGATLAFSPLIRQIERVARAAPGKAPLKYLQIIPAGGMDAVYTVDAKTTKEVTPGIDIPYAANKIVHAGPARLSPTLQPVARWIKQLAIVNGLRQNSANHQSGLQHATRLKNHTTAKTPTLFDILGSRRTEEAVGSVSIGAEFSTGFSQQYTGAPGLFLYGNSPGLFEHLDQADPEDLRTASRVMNEQATAIGKNRLSDAERTTVENLRSAATLLERSASIPKFKPDAWKQPSENFYKNGQDIQRALWLLENNLSRCVTVSLCRLHFDTHEANEFQVTLTTYLGFLLDKLFAELDKRTLDGRPLSERVVVIVGSEIGRFPRINGMLGKDHFPQVPYILYGAPFKTGAVYGETDRDMIARPVSLTTGAVDSAGQKLVLDDLGTTLLTIDGAKPDAYGYSGARLRFLEA